MCQTPLVMAAGLEQKAREGSVCLGNPAPRDPSPDLSSPIAIGNFRPPFNRSSTPSPKPSPHPPYIHPQWPTYTLTSRSTVLQQAVSHSSSLTMSSPKPPEISVSSLLARTVSGTRDPHSIVSSPNLCSRVGISPKEMEPAANRSTARSSLMRTSNSNTRSPVNSPWLMPERTPTGPSSLLLPSRRLGLMVLMSSLVRS